MKLRDRRTLFFVRGAAMGRKPSSRSNAFSIVSATSLFPASTRWTRSRVIFLGRARNFSMGIVPVPAIPYFFWDASVVLKPGATTRRRVGRDSDKMSLPSHCLHENLSISRMPGNGNSYRLEGCILTALLGVPSQSLQKLSRSEMCCATFSTSFSTRSGHSENLPCV